MRGGSGGATLTERISAVVKAGQPYAYCLPCLAVVLMAPEKLVRDSAQRAVIEDGLRVERRMCRQCGEIDDALSVKQPGIA